MRLDAALLTIQLLLDFNLLRRSYLRKFFPAGAASDSKINFIDFSLLTLVKSGQFRNTLLTAAETGISQSFFSRSLAALIKRDLIRRGAATRNYINTAEGDRRLLAAIEVNTNGYTDLVDKFLTKCAAKDLIDSFKDLALCVDPYLKEIIKHFDPGQHNELVFNSVARKLNIFGNSAFGTNRTFLELQSLNVLMHSPFDNFPLQKLFQILACHSTAAIPVVNKLKREGLLESAPLFFDKKNIFLKITPKGKDLYRATLESGKQLLPAGFEKRAEFHLRAKPGIEQMRLNLPQQILGTNPFIIQGNTQAEKKNKRCLLVPEYYIWPGLKHDFKGAAFLEILEEGQQMIIKGNFDRSSLPEIQKILRAIE